MTAQILVVDDVPANVKLLEAKLTNEYYNVIGASDGFEALKLAEPSQDLLDLEGMDETTARLLASQGIKTQEDLAECAVDELLEIEGFEKSKAETLIMTARAPWFEEAEESSA